jgi:hypothetical protein
MCTGDAPGTHTTRSQDFCIPGDKKLLNEFNLVGALLPAPTGAILYRIPFSPPNLPKIVKFLLKTEMRVNGSQEFITGVGDEEMGDGGTGGWGF